MGDLAFLEAGGPARGLGPQSGLAGSQQKSAERVWAPCCMRLAWEAAQSLRV